MAIIDRRNATVSATSAPAATSPNPGLAIKTAVRVVTTTAIDLAGIGLGPVNGVTLLDGDRALVNGQADATQNGIYQASSGVWQRAPDFADNSQVANGLMVRVTGGGAAGSAYVLTSDNPVLIGASDITFALDNFTGGFVSVRSFGAWGDDVHDDLLAFRAAVATGLDVYVPKPSVAYYVSDEIELATPGQMIFGDGDTVSVFHIKDNYRLAASGAPFTMTSGEPGAQIRDIGIEFDQPDDGVRANLVAYPPGIYAQATPRFEIHNVQIQRCITAIDMRGNSGGVLISNLKTSAFGAAATDYAAVVIDGALDSVRINDPHHWPFGLSVNQQTIFNDSHTRFLSSARCDGLVITGGMTIGGGGGMRFYESASGATFATISNHDFDGYGGLIVEAGKIELTGGFLTLNNATKTGIRHTGGSLTWVAPWLTCSGAGSNAIIDIDIADGFGDFRIVAPLFSTGEFDVTHIHAKGTPGTSIAHVTVIGSDHDRDANIAFTKPSINIEGAAARATIIGCRARDIGSGSGTFIKVDADNHHRIALNAPIGWTLDYPAASAGIYDTSLLDTTSAQLLQNKNLDSTNTFTPRDDRFTLQDSGDLTRQLKFELSGITGTRTLTVQDASGTIALTANKLSAFAATTSAELAGVISDETGSGALVFANSPALVTPDIGVATATSVNKLTITAPASSATLTIANGKTLTVSNTLTFTGTDSSSVAFGAGGTVAYTANNLSVFAATTSAQLAGIVSDETGSGALVFANTPTLVTPVLGVASATSINKVAITAPASSATLTIADGKTVTHSATTTFAGTDGKTLTINVTGTINGGDGWSMAIGASKVFTVNNTLTFSGTDSSSVAFGTGGTVAYTANNLSVFASTTSAQLAGIVSDETGSGALVFANTPTLVTPVLGVATATSVNKLTITAPASSATLTIADGKALTVSNTLTFTGTDSSSVAFGAGGTVAYTGNKLSVFAATTSAELAGVISDETGSGALVFANTPTLVTPNIGAATGTSLVLSGTVTAAFGNFTTTGDDVTVGSFLSTNLANGHFAQMNFGKAASSNNQAIVKWNQDATASSLSVQIFGDPVPGLSVGKGGLITFGGVAASATPSNNGDLMLQATSNTSLTFKYKGSDGTVRSGSVTLS